MTTKTNNKFRSRSHDLSALNDIENCSEQTKQLAEYKAAQEVELLVSKYKDLPGYLRLLAHHLSSRSEKEYSTHLQKIHNSDPKKQAYDKLKKEITSQVYRDLGLSEDDNG